MVTIVVGVLTVSDSCHAKQAEDKSGPYLLDHIPHLFSQGCDLKFRNELVPDETEQITKVLVDWSMECNLILTTGGTGFAHRDVTPEATRSVIEKEAPGLSQLLRDKSLEVTPLAALSRGVAGIRNRCLIINFPGSVKACKEYLNFVKPILLHAVELLIDKKDAIRKTHNVLQNASTDNKQITSSHSCPLHSPADSNTEHERDPSQVARRHRHSPWPLTVVSDAQALVLNEANPPPACKQLVSFRKAAGLILSTDVQAPEPHPPFPASIKDGYALKSSDGKGIRKVVATSVAGDMPNVEILTGECMRINTGAALPPGADAVIQVEDTKVVSSSDDGKIEYEVKVCVTPRTGLDIRAVGSDIAQGETVLKSGTLLKAAEIGVLAGLGITEIPVFPQPSIGVMSTGNELVEPEESIQGGKIRDSNRLTLITLLDQQGFTNVNDLGIAVDDVEQLRQLLDTSFQNNDVIMTTGGVSMGEKDFVKVVLQEEFKAEIKFGRVFMKPGKPTTFATLNYKGKKKLFFGLPGNPVSATVTCHLFVLPALMKMSGNPRYFATEISVKTSAAIQLDPRPEYQRAVLDSSADEDVPTCHVTGNQISSRLVSVCQAEVLLKLPSSSKERQVLPSGSYVRAILL